MNIAFIDVTSTVSYGGIQTAIWELARALHDQGHKVTVYGGKGSASVNLDERRIDVRTFPFTPRDRFPNFGTRFKKFAERWSFARQAKQKVVAAEHDWIIITKPFDFFWTRLLPKSSKTRIAFMSGGTDFMPLDRYLAKGIGAWLACSHFNAWQISSRYKKYPKTMFNGVDIERFNPEQKDVELRTTLGVKDGEVLFAFAGRITGWKGLDVAIRALAEPILRPIPVKLLLIGGGNALEELKRLASDLDLTDRVIFHPPVTHEQLPRYYASADAGIFPSIGDEAFGITIAEAMASGIPAVASHNGGIPEVIGNEGSTGILFEIGSVQECANAIAALIADPNKRIQLGRLARQRIVDNFTWGMAAQRMTDTLLKANDFVSNRNNAHGLW